MGSSPATASTTATRIATHIRNDVISGEYASGQRLVELELCERYDASRAVVRLALAELEHEGLVERIAHRGARVRTVSVEEAIAITEVRMVVEGLCARKAAEQVSELDIAELRLIGESMQSAVDTGDILKYRSLNVELHDAIRRIASHPVAAEILTRLLARNVRHRYRLAFRPGRARVSLVEHLAIIDDICARDPEAAERSIRRHVESVIAALRETTSGTS